MRERLKKKNNIIIGSLLAVVFLMAVGYAAFATNLNIGATSNITSTWNILITNISSTETGTATDTTTNKTPNSLTANISAELQSPGDKVTYQITVANNGSLDAKLESLTMTTSNNDAILITKSGINQGSVLEANDTAVLTVVMEYNPEVTEQPSSTTASTTITFNYVQSSEEYEELYTIEYYSATWKKGDTEQTAQAKVYEKQVHFNEQGINLTLEDMNVERMGYILNYWTTRLASSTGIRVYNDTTYSDLVSGDNTVKTIQVYAAFNTKKYTVAYDSQGGSSVQSRSNQTWTSSGFVKNKTPGRQSYSFEGWYTEPNGGGILVTDDIKLSQILNYDDSNDVNGVVTLYAKWHLNEYVITYDSDGGSAVPQRTVNWTTTNLADVTPSKQGYTFDGWYTESNKLVTNDTPFSSLTASSNIEGLTLHAHWTQN